MDDQFPRLSGKQFGRRLRQIRTSKNIPSTIIALKIGVEETYIPQLERGEKLPSFDTLVYLANALGVTTDELLCDYIEAEKTIVSNYISQKMEKLTPNQRQHIEIMVDHMISYMLEDK
jgi:transcriptional regulator with XRE-family HTH domain